ncbi:phage late control D family protein [Salinicola socius]|uniref:Late control protein n=1 Tax=Salinicola socius TaxID=404433 RepID=A0A1Q8SUM4_9GAMM|nr:phage late control D family protein [Salinicola socius]OLO05097.1 late control protein [Salinicola socius]
MSSVGRPARSPDYRLAINGQQITPRVRGRLQRLTLTDRRGLEADQLDLVLTDDDGQLALPRRGVEIHVAIGWSGEPLTQRGTFIVDEVEHSGAPDMLSIRASSANLRGQFPVKRTQSWHRTTLGDIVTTISKRHDLNPSIGQALRIVGIAHIDQTDESDINFLTRLAERYDAMTTVKAGNLLFIPAGQSTTATGLEIPPIIIRRQDGDQHRYSVSDRDSYSGVIASWYDTEGAERRDVIAGSDDNPKRLRPIYASSEDALAAAKSEWQRLKRGTAEFTLNLAEGRADIYPETPARCVGWKREIEETEWLLVEVRHEINDGGYTNSLQLETKPSI